jgi:hypothetical protein
MIVGKGRRVSSGTNRMANAIRPLNNNIESTPRSASSTSIQRLNLKCDSCDKKYNNSKDLNIHKMYCINKL